MPLLLLLAVVIVVGIVTAYSLLLFNFAATVVAFFKCAFAVVAISSMLLPLLIPLY